MIKRVSLEAGETALPEITRLPSRFIGINNQSKRTQGDVHDGIPSAEPPRSSGACLSCGNLLRLAGRRPDG
jgi:hypothetical protein